MIPRGFSPAAATCCGSQGYRLPLLLLLLSLTGFNCQPRTTAPRGPDPPSQPPPSLPPPSLRLNSARNSGICPCAYLERGGFWSSSIAASLGVANGVYVENRCRCTYEVNCVRRWQRSSKSVTVTWVGSQDARVSQIQLQFCSEVHDPTLAICSAGEVTFSLRQLGWWVDLLGVFCRCPEPRQLAAAAASAEAGKAATPQEAATAAIHRFIYAKPVGRNDRFNGRLVDFVCDSKPTCQSNEWCYEELLDTNGRLTQGSVQCTCPVGEFCPIYRIGPGARVPMYSGGSGDGRAAGEEPPADSLIIGYRLRCRSETTQA